MIRSRPLPGFPNISACELILTIFCSFRRVEWFYSQLGIDDGYFSLTNPQEVADHVEVGHHPALNAWTIPLIDTNTQSLYGAKVQAHASHQDYLEIKLEKESEVSRDAP